jgi:DNA-binding GntR family transcriptional regulator
VNRAATPIRVGRSSPVPLYFQVAQHLEQMIESSELPMGKRLECSAHDEQGRAAEHGHHVCRASRYSFELTLAGW